MISGCWKTKNRSKNFKTLQAIQSEWADYIDPPSDIKFVNPKVTDITPIAVLGVKPTGKEFINMKLKEKTKVIIFILVFNLSSN